MITTLQDFKDHLLAFSAACEAETKRTRLTFGVTPAQYRARTTQILEMHLACRRLEMIGKLAELGPVEFAQADEICNEWDIDGSAPVW